MPSVRSLALPRAMQTPDIGADGLCANGFVRIAEADGKGYGAFSEHFLFPYLLKIRVLPYGLGK